jgi:hypothetical protein
MFLQFYILTPHLLKKLAVEYVFSLIQIMSVAIFMLIYSFYFADYVGQIRQITVTVR